MFFSALLIMFQDKEIFPFSVSVSVFPRALEEQGTPAGFNAITQKSFVVLGGGLGWRLWMKVTFN